MSPAAAAVLPLAPRPQPDAQPDTGRELAAWAAWLAEAVDPGWRPGEWEHEKLLFTGDFDHPRTTAWKCAVLACPNASLANMAPCEACRKKMRVSGLSKQEFLATFVPTPNRRMGARQRTRCAVSADGQSCPRQSHCLGLCTAHFSLWIKARNRHGAVRESWITRQKPYPPLALCPVRGCYKELTTPTGLCIQHRERWLKLPAASRPEPGVWAQRAAPYLALHQFSLAPLQPVARLELLYALQDRDRRGRNIHPGATRRVIARMGDVPSLAIDPLGWPDPGTLDRTANERAVARDLRWSLGLAFDRFHGIDPKDKSTWDLAAVGLPSRVTFTGKRSQSGTVDFDQVAQGWLRDLAITWAKTTNPESVRLRERLRACVIASTALALRPGGGADPTRLGFQDITSVVDAFRAVNRKDGKPARAAWRRQLMTSFFDVLDFGRAAGLLEGMSAGFARHASHRIPPDPEPDELPGRAIPESVIRQLDEHLELIGRGVTYGPLEPSDVHALFRTAYVVLRDSGRRPGEVCALALDCLEVEIGEYQLVWDNGKGKRLRRRLPIAQETAETIEQWREKRAGLPIAQAAPHQLFPPKTSKKGIGHLDPCDLSTAIRSFADSVPVLLGEATGPDGLPLPFDRSLIFPYAFRHSYTQRHADAGIRVELLRDLMDHKYIDTTMGYYKVSLERKREAVNTMRRHVMDRAGQPAPVGSAVGYEAKTVSVPFGGCKEPSNVKAGGKACPIRFQCAGCGFYRPDPSYLPAIEEQVRALKADRETAAAMGVESFVIRNLDEQIEAFRLVAQRMREKLEGLEPHERARVEQASAVLRKMRATENQVLLPVPIVRPRQPAS